MSTLDFTKALKAKPKTKYVVYGYVRGIQEQLSSQSLHDEVTPPLIEHICLCFYHLNDEWDERATGSLLEQSGNTLTHSRALGQSSAYLKNVVSKGQHRWKFKLGQCNNWTLIGLAKIRKMVNTDRYFTFGGEKSGYAYIVPDGKLGSLESGDWGGNSQKYGRFKPTEGDIVEMVADFEALEIRYIVNGIDFGVAFRNIEQTEYRAAVNMYYSHDSITLIEG